jgi:phosphoribosylformylglycinamidine synthase
VIKSVQGKGRVNAEVAVMRPVLSSRKGVVISYGINPSYSDIDTYHMAACAIDSAIRAAVSGGADVDKMALLDNFCWCSSNEPERLYQLKQAAKACYDYSIAFGTPFISGKDSMFNDFKGFDEKGAPLKISVPPTLLVSTIAKSISIDIKFPGDLVYIIGDTKEELGASEYFGLLSEEYKKRYVGNVVPKVDAFKNKKVYQAFHKAAKENLISAAASVGRGGLGVALCKMAMAGRLGLDINLKNLPGSTKNDAAILFSESQGRIVMAVAPANRKRFEKIMAKVDPKLIGRTSEDNKLAIKNKSGRKIVDLRLDKALKDYRKTFKGF